MRVLFPIKPSQMFAKCVQSDVQELSREQHCGKVMGKINYWKRQCPNDGMFTPYLGPPIPGVAWYISSRGTDTAGCGANTSAACETLDSVLENHSRVNNTTSSEPLWLITDTNLILDNAVMVRLVRCFIHICGFHIGDARSFLGDLRWVARFEPNQCEPNRSTYRQRLPKVCQQQFHGQDEN